MEKVKAKLVKFKRWLIAAVTIIIVFLASFFAIPILFPPTPSTGTTRNFGYETIGASTQTIENQIDGSLFTATESGIATCMYVAIRWTSSAWTGKIKTAIYFHGNLSLLAATTERTIALTNVATWYQFNFSGSPAIVGGTEYLLEAWAQSLAGTCCVAYNMGDTNQEHYKSSSTYDGFPDPFVPSHYDEKLSIYCTYTVSNTANLGKTTLGASSTLISFNTSEYIAGTVFNITEDGRAENMTVALKGAAAASTYAKCAIYNYADLVFVGKTQQVYIALTTSFVWYTFNFSTPKPSMFAYKDYLLVVWAEYWGANNNVYAAYDLTLNVSRGKLQNKAYEESDGFPNPYVPSSSPEYNFSIYCSYTRFLDIRPPTYSDVATNSTFTGQPTNFYAKCTDETGLATTGGFIYGTNNTGAWQNETWTAFTTTPDWGNKTKTLNATVGTTVQWQEWFNDTSDNWNTTGLQSLTVTYDGYTDWNTVAINGSDNGNWTAVGAAPWLGAADYPTNYLKTEYSGNRTGNFTFPTLSTFEYQWVIELKLELNFSKNVTASTIIAEFWNTTSWYNVTYATTATTWTVMNGTLTPSSWSPALLSGLKVRFLSNDSATLFQIDYARLYVHSWTLVNRLRFYLDAQALNWTETGSSYYGLFFGKTNVTDLESMIDSLAAQTDWVGVLEWSTRLAKLGIEREESIKYALGNLTKEGELPFTYTYDGKGCYRVANRDVLYSCYYYAEKFGYLTDKWNKTKAWNFFRDAIHVNTTNQHITWVVFADGNATTFMNRFYDEAASTLSSYLVFHELGVTGALDDAVDVWGYLNDNYWNDTDRYFKYQPFTLGYECSGAYFLRIIAMLRWFKSDIPYADRLTEDTYQRFFENEWLSPQWTTSLTPTESTYYVIHFNTGNPQRRLLDTPSAWATFLGVYSVLNSTAQDNMKDMLKEVWYSLYQPNGWCFVPATEQFKWTSNDATTSDTATIRALMQHLITGMIPINTTIAFPLQEMTYVDAYDVDPELFGINMTARTVKTSICAEGALRFIYGGVPVDYKFASSGVYSVAFNSSWTGITDVTRLGDLPTGRKYFYPIVVSNVGVDGDTYINLNVTFRTYWQSFTGMNCSLFYWNSSGTMQQNGTLNLSGSATWSNFTRTLPATECYIAWYIVANDTNNNWANTTTQYIHVLARTPLTVGWNSFTTCTADVGHTLSQVNTSLYTDSINYVEFVFEYANGTRYVFFPDWGGDATVPVTSDGKFYILCNVAGYWRHTYP